MGGGNLSIGPDPKGKGLFWLVVSVSLLKAFKQKAGRPSVRNATEGCSAAEESLGWITGYQTILRYIRIHRGAQINRPHL